VDEVTREKLEAIRRGELSIVENVERALERIEKLNPKVNAFIEVNPEARAQAEALERKLRRGERLGKLAGLTIGVKSNINVLDLRATCASKTLEDYVSAYDAEVIRRVKAADGIIIGMTNMDEFACGSSGRRALLAPPITPPRLDTYRGARAAAARPPSQRACAIYAWAPTRGVPSEIPPATAASSG
jgi:aspartyl-tRNA(Asn)/glutamyl-tRNA(Gln) amidotransferase subunit A